MASDVLPVAMFCICICQQPAQPSASGCPQLLQFLHDWQPTSCPPPCPVPPLLPTLLLLHKKFALLCNAFWGEGTELSSVPNTSGKDLPNKWSDNWRETVSRNENSLQSGRSSPAKHGGAYFSAVTGSFKRSDCCSRTVWEPRMLEISRHWSSSNFAFSSLRIETRITLKFCPPKRWELSMIIKI